MSARWRWLWLLALMALGLSALLGDGGGVAASSTLTRASAGWSGARVVLDSWDVPSRLRDRPFDRNEDDEGTAEPPGTTVLAFPFQRPWQPGEIDALLAWLGRGGTLVVAYGGRPVDVMERRLLEALGIERSAPTPLTLVPWKWSVARRARWQLTPTARTFEDLRPLDVTAPRAWPIAPEHADVLYAGGPENVAAVFSLTVRRGRVLILPGDAWSNGRLDRPGHADLLATVAASAPPPWVFDEFHHGWIDPAVAAERRAAAVVIAWGPIRLTYWDVLAWHLLALYGLGVWALGRPLGPQRPASPVAAGSTATFLRGLGALHARLGHHQAVARRLADRVDGPAGARWAERAATVHGADRLVAFARDLFPDLRRPPRRAANRTQESA